jgi:precorrin-6B C5,15-methyltransferase / cobalt-precorrin-6B C5,C15-methyltransferase
MSPHAAVTVVGIGADGWVGLADAARTVLCDAEVVIGASRQLDLLPPEVNAEKVTWPVPLRQAVGPLLEAHAGRALAVLASGDPMWHGIGRALVEEVGPDRLRVLPHPSSVSLACAALGWPVEDTDVVSLVSQPVETILAGCYPGARLLVLSRDGSTPAKVAKVLSSNGFGASAVTVLGSLGGPAESRTEGKAQTADLASCDALNVVAIEVAADAGAPHRGVVPGLPDDAFEHDGQITKREVRALTLSALAPAPGELLWDIGGGSGSVAIEWLLAHPRCRALSVERSPERAARIVRNAVRLGTPRLVVVEGSAPAALAGLDQPDAVFIGGGLTGDGVVSACWERLRPGGRLVANAVTIESQSEVSRLQARFGGTLLRIDLARQVPVGALTAWRPAMPVVQWSVTTPQTGQG